jgi:hypothetical protein
MSFIDTLFSVGKKVWNFATETEIGKGLTQTIISGYALNKVSKSIAKEQQKADQAISERPDNGPNGVREQIDPDTDARIPIVYGEAFVGGVVTDARMTDDNQTMWYCVTLCEKTGVKLSDNQPSVIEFLEVYWNQNKIVFRPDGITAASFTNDDGVNSNTVDGLIRFYPFSGNSTLPVRFQSQSQGNTAAAYDLFPQWTAQHFMTDLVFCIIRVDYSAENSVTGLGTLEFKLRNTMTKPGDVLNDYLRNTRYGAGIDEEEIFAQ